MKTKLLLAAAACFLFYCFASAQTQLSPTQWENAKQNGTLNGKEKAAPSTGNAQPFVEYRLAPNIPVHPASNTCQCWQTRDSSWDIVPVNGGTPPEYRNDDGSTNLIPLPFTFCLYGTTWTDCYINNNGNISFGSPYGTFTATGFPNPTFIMVAPFWSDVDTRGGAGLPHYKITSTYMVVQWDSVGYYGVHIDKLNTFQVIITNGSDPIVPGGNVSFCYKDMQWTTGDASSGVGGFGGSDAIVGANSGDGINYIQFGAFNQPGPVYNGPAGPNSGIDWLDNQTFLFDACTSTNNVPPTASGITICDTLHLCEGDSLPLNVTFFSPEVAQTTVITVDTTGTTGYVIVSNTPGNTASLVSYFVGTASNSGYNTIIITATDNGAPPGITNIPIVIEVSTPPVTTITPDTTICNGPVTLIATGGGTYDWLPITGLSCNTCANPVATPTITTTYTVTIDNGCPVNRTVTVYAPPVITITPDTTICSGTSKQLNVSGGTSYTWLPTSSLNNPNIANPIATPTVTTSYTVTVVNGNFASCTRTATITITVVPSPTAVASNDTTICVGTPANLISSGGSTYSWSPTTNLNNPNISNQIATPPTTTTYIVTVSNGNCTDNETVIVTVQSATATAGPDTTVCLGQPAHLNASGGISYSWSPTTGLNNPNIANPIATPSVTTTYTCTVTNALGCTDTDIATVTVAPLPTSLFSSVPTTNLPDSLFFFTDQSTGGVVNWIWTFGDGGTSNQQNPTHSYSTAGIYRVCLVTVGSNGCVDTACTDVDVIIPPVIAPNVFTPNNDGTNDLLVFTNLEYYQNAHLEVYDRWGVKVYASDNYLNNWNGRKMGSDNECIDGTYYYILSGSTRLDPMTGFVELIRGK